VSDTIRDLLENGQIILVPEFSLMDMLTSHYYNRHSQPRHIVDVRDLFVP
jgi:hypothetical protein